MDPDWSWTLLERLTKRLKFIEKEQEELYKGGPPCCLVRKKYLNGKQKNCQGSEFEVGLNSFVREGD